MSIRNATARYLARRCERHVAELRRNLPVVREARLAAERLAARMAHEVGRP